MSLQNKMFPKLFTTRLHFSLPIDLTIYLSLKNLCSKDETRVPIGVCFCSNLLIKRVPWYLLFIEQPDDVPTRYPRVSVKRKTNMEPETHPLSPLPKTMFGGDRNSRLKYTARSLTGGTLSTRYETRKKWKLNQRECLLPSQTSPFNDTEWFLP